MKIINLKCIYIKVTMKLKLIYQKELIRVLIKFVRNNLDWNQ